MKRNFYFRFGQQAESYVRGQTRGEPACLARPLCRAGPGLTRPTSHVWPTEGARAHAREGTLGVAVRLGHTIWHGLLGGTNDWPMSMSSWQAPTTHAAPTRHVLERLTAGCDDIPATVVDGGLGRVFDLVLHDEGYIRSMPRQGNEDEIPRRDGSSKRGGWSSAR
jgi:hypothetical protein